MAIAFDASSDGLAAVSVSSLSWNHTVGAGNQRILWAWYDTNDVTDLGIGGTYNGIPMTPLAPGVREASAFRWHHLLYLLNPPVGTAAIVVSASGVSGRIEGMGTSYTGVRQEGPAPYGADVLGGDPAAVPLLVTADDAWILAVGFNGSGSTHVFGGGVSLRQTNASQSSVGLADSHGPLAAGSHTPTVAGAGSDFMFLMAVAFNPAVSGPIDAPVGWQAIYPAGYRYRG